MELAVLSDIHGNYAAFKKCYEYALSKNINTFVFLGDYLGEFAYPQKTMQLIYEMSSKHECYFVRGNKEDYWINRRKNVNCEWIHGNRSVYPMVYCFDNLTERDLDFFESLPLNITLSFEGTTDLFVCHGSPNSNREKMITSNPNFAQIIDDCHTRYILCGHTHIQAEYVQNEKFVLNPGAVGVPLYSANGNAQLMIMKSNANNWTYEFVSLDYDKRESINDLKESGLYEHTPYWCQITEHLIYNSKVSHGQVLNRAYALCSSEMGSCTWYDIPDRYWNIAIGELLK